MPDQTSDPGDLTGKRVRFVRDVFPDLKPNSRVVARGEQGMVTAKGRHGFYVYVLTDAGLSIGVHANEIEVIP